MKQNQIFQEVRNWIYRNARPIDLFRWQYHFEKGSSEMVLKALEEYQNEDGGFGYGLEVDSWNPNSAPIQTFHGIKLIEEVGLQDKQHSIIKGILKYLDSGSEFDGKVWSNTMRSNNDYPHAPWWEHGSESTSHTSYNPTAGLVGFALRYSEQDTRLYQTCAHIACEAVNYLMSVTELDMHTLENFITLYQYCEKANVNELFSLALMKDKLKELVTASITKDTNVWATSYVCKPSMFFNSPTSIFYQDNKAIADYECDFIINSRSSDGVWDVTWGWEAYAQEWAISRNWWMGSIAIDHMRYLKNFGVTVQTPAQS